jgi:hypothetical protein
MGEGDGSRYRAVLWLRVSAWDSGEAGAGHRGRTGRDGRGEWSPCPRPLGGVSSPGLRAVDSARRRRGSGRGARRGDCAGELCRRYAWGSSPSSGMAPCGPRRSSAAGRGACRWDGPSRRSRRYIAPGAARPLAFPNEKIKMGSYGERIGAVGKVVQVGREGRPPEARGPPAPPADCHRAPVASPGRDLGLVTPAGARSRRGRCALSLLALPSSAP